MSELTSALSDLGAAFSQLGSSVSGFLGPVGELVIELLLITLYLSPLIVVIVAVVMYARGYRWGRRGLVRPDRSRQAQTPP